MSLMRIDFSDAPKDPIERLVWLSGAQQKFDSEVRSQWQRAYFEARLTSRLATALGLRLHSRKRVLSFTRAENERTGRQVHWGDGES